MEKHTSDFAYLRAHTHILRICVRAGGLTSAVSVRGHGLRVCKPFNTAGSVSREEGRKQEEETEKWLKSEIILIM